MKNDDLFEENDLSKSEIYAERIMQRIHTHNLSSGGILSLITGAMGSAKTSVLLSFMDYTLCHHPKEKVFWSSTYDAPLQFVRSKNKYVFLVKEGSGVTFHDRSKQLKQVYPEVIPFTDYKDLFNKAPEGVCCAVFFGDRTLNMEFVHFLRRAGCWTHLFCDEISEVCPAFTSGKLFHRIGNFAVDLKEVRKALMNVHCNTQSIADIDHRCRSKVMLRVFLPGAKAGKDSRLSQGALDNLEEDPVQGNMSYVELMGRFGLVRFKDIYAPNHIQWEAHVNDKED